MPRCLSHTSILSLIRVCPDWQVLPIANPPHSISSKSHCRFLGPTLFFPRSPLSSRKKRDRRGTKNRKNTAMANSTPPPGSPYIVPPGVTNTEINIANDPLSSPVPPDVGFDDWTAADTERIVAMSGCSDDRLRACIVAASSSVWGVREMYPTQIDAV